MSRPDRDLSEVWRRYHRRDKLRRRVYWAGRVVCFAMALLDLALAGLLWLPLTWRSSVLLLWLVIGLGVATLILWRIVRAVER